MWEQIAANRRKSTGLVITMALLLMVLGFFLGEYLLGEGGGVPGVGIAFGVWLIMTLVAYFQGDSIYLAMAGAKKVEKADLPILFNVVEEMTLAAGLAGVVHGDGVDGQESGGRHPGPRPQPAGDEPEEEERRQEAGQGVLEQRRPEGLARLLLGRVLPFVGLSARLAGFVFDDPTRRYATELQTVFDGTLDRPYREDDVPHPTSVYGRSKLANLLFTYELQRRYDAIGADAMAVAAHPGGSNTNADAQGGIVRG